MSDQEDGIPPLEFGQIPPTAGQPIDADREEEHSPESERLRPRSAEHAPRPARPHARAYPLYVVPGRYMAANGMHAIDGLISEVTEEFIIRMIDAAPWNSLLTRRRQIYNRSIRRPRSEGNYIDGFPVWTEPLIHDFYDRGLYNGSASPNELSVWEFLPGQGVCSFKENPENYIGLTLLVFLGGAVNMIFQKSDFLIPYLAIGGNVLLLNEQGKQWLRSVPFDSHFYDPDIDQLIPRTRHITLMFRHVVR